MSLNLTFSFNIKDVRISTSLGHKQTIKSTPRIYNKSFPMIPNIQLLIDI